MAHTTQNSPASSPHKKPLFGLVMSQNLKIEKVPSIPCKEFSLFILVDESRKPDPDIGPGTYDPNFDFTHKKMPQHLISIGST